MFRGLWMEWLVFDGLCLAYTSLPLAGTRLAQMQSVLPVLRRKAKPPPSPTTAFRLRRTVDRASLGMSRS